MLSGKVDLAHEPDFVIGRLTVSPSRREVVRDDGQREVLEHRVMQVLIALSRAGGSIVTRDELIMLCWDGRVVGEDAIHRVISRLRKLATGIGAGSIEIETITKIGYRLSRGHRTEGGPVGSRLGEAQGATSPRTAASPTRRGLMFGALAAGTAVAGAGGFILYRRFTRPPVPPEVEALVVQARQLRELDTRESQYQAIGLMRRVVALAPDYADGWGQLGCAYAAASHSRDWTEAISLRSRAMAAARRAFALDPGNGFGQMAISQALPMIGHWHERDRRMEQALLDRPGDSQLLAYRAQAFAMVGRHSEALRYFERIRERPFTPRVYASYIHALWSAGQAEETDRALVDAAELYPAHSTVWIAHFHIRLLGGNPTKAIALAEDEKGWPEGLDRPTLIRWVEQARAIDSHEPALVEKVAAAQLKRARVSAFGASSATRVLCALGRTDQAFDVVNAYYFGRGFSVPDSPTPGSRFTPEQRQTWFLFEPVTGTMRADPRFEPLVGEIGLERYWRESRTRPDYRHMA